MRTYFFWFFLLIFISFNSCRQDKVAGTDSKIIKKKEIKKDTIGHTDLIDISYTGDGMTFKSFYSKPLKHDTLKPLVLVIPEWWGNNDYIRYRVGMVADLGYIAMGVDMYGDGFVTESPKVAAKRSSYFYSHGKEAYKRFMAALKYGKTIPGVDTTKIAVMGYCFGGAIASEMAFAGAPVKGSISYHGELPQEIPDTNLLKAPMLVICGDDDKFVTTQERETFKHNMDKVGGYYKYVSIPGAKHGFTNPRSTELGKKYNLDIAYNKMADEQTWRELQMFLYLIF